MHLRDIGAVVEDAAEVGDLDIGDALAVHQHQHVGRLHVAMDEALAPAVVERHRALEADFEHLRQRQQRIGAAKAPERDAGHMLHHEVGQLFVFGNGVQDLHDIGVVQLPDECRFGSEEALLEMCLALIDEGRAAHALDGHVVAAERVAGEEDLARRAFADLGLDAVFADARRRGAVARGCVGGGVGAGAHIVTWAAAIVGQACRGRCVEQQAKAGAIPGSGRVLPLPGDQGGHP